MLRKCLSDAQFVREWISVGCLVTAVKPELFIVGNPRVLREGNGVKIESKR